MASQRDGVNHYATICVGNDTAWVASLAALRAIDSTAHLHVLHLRPQQSKLQLSDRDSTHYSLRQLWREKYWIRATMRFGWSDKSHDLVQIAKPLFLSYLLKSIFAPVIFIGDEHIWSRKLIRLRSSFRAGSICLCSNDFEIDPGVDFESYARFFTEGFYTAEIFGWTPERIPAIEWWAAACSRHKVSSASTRLPWGQVYLNLVPVIWPDTTIVRPER